MSCMRTGTLGITLVSAIAWIISGCGEQGDVGVARFEMGLVLDRAVHRYTESFRIWAGLADLNGSRVTCDQIPAKYLFEDFNRQGASNLACSNSADCTTQIPWNGGTDVATGQLRVLTGRPVIIVAEAVASRGAEPFYIGRGCYSAPTGFVDGQNPPVEIDLKASVGASCTTGTCERHLTCQSGAGYPQGYCTQSCSTNAECPPGSHCVSSATRTFCAQRCDTLQDCNAGAGQECLPQQGPDGCEEVCIVSGSPRC